MPIDSSETNQPCPMCGRMVSAGLTTCPGCGERLGTRYEPEVTHVDYWALLNLLGLLWIGWSLFSGCAGLYFLPEQYEHDFTINAPLVFLMLSISSLTWFVSGLATLQKEMWGVYLGHVFSYVTLLANLFYWNPLGIFVAVVFILLSRTVLKRYRQLKGPGGPSDDESI